MAEPEKLRSLRNELTEHQKRLEELKQRYGSPEAQGNPNAVHEHHLSLHEVLASTVRTVETLIETLGGAGL
jgi:chromosome segregation ATPase